MIGLADSKVSGITIKSRFHPKESYSEPSSFEDRVESATLVKNTRFE